MMNSSFGNTNKLGINTSAAIAAPAAPVNLGINPNAASNINASFNSFNTSSNLGLPPQQFNTASGFDLNAGSLAQATSDATGNALQKIQIRTLHLHATKPQRNQHRRGYTVYADGNTINAINNAVDEKGVAGINASTMSTIMSDCTVGNGGLVRYNGTPEAAIGIENGWEASRFRFVMLVDVYRRDKFWRTEIISGYTDEQGVMNAGLNNSRSIDPNMTFVINSVSEAQVRNHYSSYGSMASSSVSIMAANNILRNDAWNGVSSGTQLYTMRPEDVFEVTTQLPIIHGMQQAEAFGASPRSYMTTGTVLANTPRMSSRHSDLTPTYATRVIGGLLRNQLPDESPMSYDGMGAAASAAANNKDSIWSQNMFGFVMGQKGSNVFHTGTFTYSDLMRLDPTVDDRTTVMTNAYEQAGSMLQVPNGTDADTIGAGTDLALAATMIANTTMALMSIAGCSLLFYNASNFTDVGIGGFKGMDTDGLLHTRVEALRQRLKLEALDVISYGGKLDYQIEVLADVFNDIHISIILDGDRGDFVVPAFASATMAPVVTSDQDRVTSLAGAVMDIVNECGIRTGAGHTGHVSADPLAELFSGTNNQHDF